MQCDCELQSWLECHHQACDVNMQMLIATTITTQHIRDCELQSWLECHHQACDVNMQMLIAATITTQHIRDCELQSWLECHHQACDVNMQMLIVATITTQHIRSQLSSQLQFYTASQKSAHSLVGFKPYLKDQLASFSALTLLVWSYDL